MSNREWLKQLAPSAMPLEIEGVHRLETRHSIYVFRDGVCVDIARRDGEEPSNAETSMVGMRVVGWLLDIEGHRRLLDRWLPGARAVMWRAADKATHTSSKIAMTSPAFAFVVCSQVDENEEDMSDCDTTAEYVPLPARVASTGSFTRLFPQDV